MAHVSDAMRECIDECSRCHQVCTETLNHCLQMGGRHAEAKHVTLLLDCAEICATCEDFLLRGSDLYIRVCSTCAEVCERCAQDCAQFSEDFMQRCAETCRRCAESCRRMSAPQPVTQAA